jgi:homoserine kinase
MRDEKQAVFSSSLIPHPSSFEVRVPASTSNLGAGFDCFGLALRLYLTVRARVMSGAREACRVRACGSEGAGVLPLDEGNLIYRAMCWTAERLDQELPPMRLAVRNEIPVGRGLGSSAAAIVAGIKLSSLLCGRELDAKTLLAYATELEGHPDNAAPAIYGGWAVTCCGEDGRVLAVRRSWPGDIKILIVSPDAALDTKRARAALPRMVSHADAVYNLQRAALFTVAIEAREYSVLWEAMRDRLHQERRADLLPGLREALETPRQPGLLGVALSGAGPSVLALVQDNFDRIGASIADCFHRRGLRTDMRLLKVDEAGLKVS